MYCLYYVLHNAYHYRDLVHDQGPTTIMTAMTSTTIENVVTLWTSPILDTMQWMIATTIWRRNACPCLCDRMRGTLDTPDRETDWEWVYSSKHQEGLGPTLHIYSTSRMLILNHCELQLGSVRAGLSLKCTFNLFYMQRTPPRPNNCKGDRAQVLWDHNVEFFHFEKIVFLA